MIWINAIIIVLIISWFHYCLKNNVRVNLLMFSAFFVGAVMFAFLIMVELLVIPKTYAENFKVLEHEYQQKMLGCDVWQTPNQH